MRKMIPVFFWILLTLGTVTAQTGKVTRPLEPWMTGLIAVAGFLFIVFVAFLVNKAWFGDSSLESSAEPTKTSEFNMTNGQTYSRGLDMLRSSDHENAYENGGVQEMDDTITTMCSDHENGDEQEMEYKITAM